MSKRQRYLETRDIGTYIIHGAYAFVCSSKSDQKYIWRLEIVEEKEMINRQYKVHKFLLCQNIGPCFPMMAHSDIITLNDLEGSLRDMIEKTVKKYKISVDSAKIWATKIEKGDVNSMTNFRFTSIKQASEILFMLIWSLWSANSQYGFRHRDIKGENIVLKKLPEKRKITFHVQDFETYTVTTDWLPMIIDYGFASLSTTKDKHRYKIGTFAAAPPEVISHALMYTNYNINVRHNGLFSEDGFDIWSAALSVLLSALDLNSLFAVKKKAVLNNIGHIFGHLRMKSLSKEMHTKYATFARLCFLQNAIGNKMFPSSSLISIYYPSFLFTIELKCKLDKFESKHGISENYRERYEKIRYTNFGRTVRKLLSWNPKTRVSSGELYSIFKHLVNATDTQQKPDYTAAKKSLLDFQ